MSALSTVEDDPEGPDAPERPLPGLLVVCLAGQPRLLAIPLVRGTLVLGREGDGGLEDERVSRAHTEVSQQAGRFRVRDLGSRNGTYVDGVRLSGDLVVAGGALLRLGGTLAIPLPDVRPFVRADVVSTDGLVAGPTFRRALDAVTAAAQSSDTLLVTGESGTGKELAAKRFHAAGPHRAGRFVAVNCAAIPEHLAERLLFGAQRGAYTGATAAEGHVQAAAGGVLFLDEVAELHLDVQAKLLRLLEEREIIPLGASVAEPVAVRICCATHRDLRAAVTGQRLRPDLYYRLTKQQIRLPALRERREEIPHLVAGVLAGVPGAPRAHVRFLEQCLLRPWPGNVRELSSATRRAAEAAVAAGEASVDPRHLGADAGLPLEASSSAPNTATAPTQAEVEAALERNGRNVAQTARDLGLHRNQLYRLLERLGIKLRDEA